jgi:hypothetical protein
MIKSRRMRWAGHVARMGRSGMHIGYWCESQMEGNHCGDLDIGGRITLKWILEIWIDLAQRRDQWMALANTVMNLRVP